MSGFFTRVNFIRQRIQKCGVLTRRKNSVRHRASRFLRLCRLTGMTEKPRIEPLPPQRANWLIRAMSRYAARRFGEVPEPFAVVAHHPRLLVATAAHETMMQSASRKLPANVRELAVFWTARTIGCSWCVDFGSMLQRLDGLDVQRLKEIDNYATSPVFSDD